MSNSSSTSAPVLRSAYQYLQAGCFAEALAAADAQSENQRNTVEWRTLRSVVLSLLKRPAEALEEYRVLVQMQSNNAAHWSNLGNCLCELGREQEALEPLQKALLLGATESALHFGLARAYAVAGPLELARRHIETAVQRDPGDVEFHLFRLRVLQGLDRWPEARACANHLQAMPLDEGQRVDFAYLLFRGQWYEEAIAQLVDEPKDAELAMDARIGLVMCYERTNRLDRARSLQQTLSFEAVQHNPKLHQNFMQMQAKMAMREKNYSLAKQSYEQLLASLHNDAGLKIGLQFEYAAALDKLGLAVETMRVMQAAHGERRSAVSRVHRDLQDKADAFAVLDQSVPDWNPLVHGADAYPDPVFVVGFPRSGTTLLEQLLDAHPQLVSFDEQPFLQHLVRRMSADKADVMQAIRQMDTARWLSERQHYFVEVTTVAELHSDQQPVDKNPLNMVRMSLLQNFFPESKVILAIRHPCDVVLSCYMQHFRAPAFALTFETLESAAQMYDKVFTHWYRHVEQLRLPVLEWKYEDLVADTEHRARTLFDFLQLPWHDELLQFTDRAKQKNVIKTPSYTQVVEQVNSRSIGRWQAYRDYFTPEVMRYLNPWLERFGY
jgi:tetratricopeptide (TPR) repeat protein